MWKTAVLVAVFVVVLAWAYSPVCSGYYLMEDDLWTYIDRSKPLEANQAFASQAQFAGRPLGALWDYSVVKMARSIDDVNRVRAISIALLCGIGFLLFVCLRPLFLDKTVVLSVAYGATLLPCFQSPAIKYFEMNSLVSCLSSLAAGLFVARLYDAKRRYRSLGYALVSTAVLAASLAMYQHSALAAYVVVLVCILECAQGDKRKVEMEAVAVLFVVPAAAMLLYLVMYKAFISQHVGQSLVVSFSDLLERVAWFVKYPLPMGTDYLNLLSPVSYSKPFFDSLSSYVFLLSLAITCCAFMYVYSGLMRMQFKIRVFLFLLLAASYVCAVGPSMLSNVDNSAYRRLQPMQTMLFVLTMYLAYALLSRVGHHLRSLIFFLMFLGLAWRANDVVGYKVDLVSTEYRHIRATLEHCFDKGHMAHFITSPRYANHQDFVGLMTNFKAWIPGVTLVILQDIKFADDETAKAVAGWTLGTANDQVTSSTIDEYRHDNVYIPEGTCLVDMTPLSARIVEGMTWADYQKVPASEDAPAAHTAIEALRASSFVVLAGHVAAFSSGDFAGYTRQSAFDGDYIRSRWASAQVGPQVKGTAFLGVEFAREESVDGFLLRQGGAVSSISLSYSENGEDWKELDKIRVVPDSNVHLYVANKSAPAARFWRVVAAGELPYPAAWSVYELTFIKLQGGK